MLRWYYSVDAVTVLEITDRVRKPDPAGQGGISVGSHAEEGSGWEGTINVDDEDGDLIMLMHRRIYAVQDAAPVDHQVVGNWFITDLEVIRGTPPVGASRIWVVQMADENSLLSRRVFVGGDSNRPAETDIERIQWLLTTTELNTLDPDEDFIDTAGPVDMDAVDYTGQKPDQVISDCSQQSGKNYFVMYREDLTPNVYALAYFNANTSDLYPSTASLSNVEPEIDDSTVFAISQDARLSRAGGRSPTSGMYLPYTGGYVYQQDTDVGDTYVYRDVAAPSVNVKTAPKATARAIRLLAELDEPDDEVEAEIIVDEANVNDAMHGMSIPLHATHFPNYTEDSFQPAYALGTMTRIMRRQVRQVGPKEFGVRMWLTPMTVAACSTESLDPYFDEERRPVESSFESFAIPAPPAGLPSVIVALLNVESAFISVGPDVVLDTSGDWGSLGSWGVPLGDGWHDVVCTGYLPQPAGTPETFDATLTFVQGTLYYTDWCLAAVAIATSDTAPVQSAVSVGPNPSHVTLSSPPTPGNILVMLSTMREDIDTAPSGWTQLADIPHGGGGGIGGDPPDFSHIYVFATCVPAGMGTTITMQAAIVSRERHMFVSEWTPA